MRDLTPCHDWQMVGPIEALSVESLDGPRWALALSLLESGKAAIRLGSIQVWRSTSGPLADGRMSVTVEVAERVSEAAALRALDEAHRIVDAAASRDELSLA